MITEAMIIRDAISVKNADLICLNRESMDYNLQHYDTIILKVRCGLVVELRPVTRSSTRAINQGLEYLHKSHVLVSSMECKDYIKNSSTIGVSIVREY